VRLLKVLGVGRLPSFKLEIQLMLQGEFDALYTMTGNRLMGATKNRKNNNEAKVAS
jgi:hypothetical protein